MKTTTGRIWGTFRTRTLPSGRVQASYVVDGARFRAPVTFASKADAGAWLDMRHAEVLEHRWKPTPPPEPSMDTFEGYARRWLADRELKPRTRAEYQRTLDLLEQVKQIDPQMITKSGLMLGLGETIEELFEVLADLRKVGCDMLTLGQYLQPSPTHLPVERFVPPEEFDEIGEQARKLGFSFVASGPFVRSSYHAGEMAEQFRSSGT